MKATNCALLISMILCTALCVLAQDETSTEIQGFYQSYRNFSYYSGDPYYSFSPMKLAGGGFTIARNLASYFAMWTQFTFYGSPEKDNFKLGIMNNLQGLRFQTKLHGPFRFYAKGGIGFTRYNIDMVLDNIAAYSYSDSSFSVGYGGGAQIWLGNHFGIILDVSQVHMGLPNLLDADLPDREKWDSGMTYTTGLALRF
jgi:hypothetical protein